MGLVDPAIDAEYPAKQMICTIAMTKNRKLPTQASIVDQKILSRLNYMTRNEPKTQNETISVVAESRVQPRDSSKNAGAG